MLHITKKIHYYKVHRYMNNKFDNCKAAIS